MLQSFFPKTAILWGATLAEYAKRACSNPPVRPFRSQSGAWNTYAPWDPRKAPGSTVPHFDASFAAAGRNCYTRRAATGPLARRHARKLRRQLERGAQKTALGAAGRCREPPVYRDRAAAGIPVPGANPCHQPARRTPSARTSHALRGREFGGAAV